MPLLATDPGRTAPPESGLADDRAPDWVAAGTPQPLRGELEELLGADRVLGRAIDIVRYASDASPYRLFPKAVVMAHDAADVAKVLDFGRRRGIPVTLRSAGTSLNGQGQGDGILVDVRRHFSGVAERLADEVHQPPSAQCCGFAGDRGLLHPELTEAATREEAAELAGSAFDAHVCGNRTCEIGLERATGRAYGSPVELVERLTRP